MRLPRRDPDSVEGIGNRPKWGTAALAAAGALTMAGNADGDGRDDEVAFLDTTPGCPDAPVNLPPPDSDRYVFISESGDVMIHTDYRSLTPKEKFRAVARVGEDIRLRLQVCKDDQPKMTTEVTGTIGEDFSAQAQIECERSQGKGVSVKFATGSDRVNYVNGLVVLLEGSSSRTVFVASSIHTRCTDMKGGFPCLIEVVGVSVESSGGTSIGESSAIQTRIQELPPGNYGLLPTDSHFVATNSWLDSDARGTFAGILDLAGIPIPTANPSIEPFLGLSEKETPAQANPNPYTVPIPTGSSLLNEED